MAEQSPNQPSFLFMMVTLIAAILIGDVVKTHVQSRLADAAACSLLALAVAAQSRWDLKRKSWFWAALGLGAILQLPIIFLMPWQTRHLTAMAALAFVLPGFLMALACIFLAEKLFVGGIP